MLVCAIFHLALRRRTRGRRQRGSCRRLPRAGVLAILAALAMLAFRRPAPLFALNHGRAAGFFVTANQFAAYLDAFAFAALGVALATRSPRLRLSPVLRRSAFVALALTFSRSGWAGALAAGFFLAWTFERARSPRADRAGRARAGRLCAAPGSPSRSGRFVQPARNAQAGVRAAALFPLTGVGPMAYWRVYPSLRLPNGAPPGSFGAFILMTPTFRGRAKPGATGVVALLLGWWVFARSMRRTLAPAPPAARRFGWRCAPPWSPSWSKASSTRSGSFR